MSRLLLPLRALRRRLGVALGALLLGSAAAQAQAPTIYGLGTLTQALSSGNVFGLPPTPAGSQGIVPIDPATGPAGNPILVTGVTVGQKLVGIDSRPATGVVYALGYDPTLSAANAQLYTLVPSTGVATPVNATPITLDLGTSVTRIGFDFNPVADLIRVVATNRADYRLNPNTGAINNTDPLLAYAASDPNAGQTPGVGTAAYTNSVVGATTTALYDIDELNGARLVTQDPPNGGILNTVAAINNPASFVNFALALGLDIDVYYNPATGTDQAYLMEVSSPTLSGINAGYSSSNIYSIDLTNGQTSGKVNVVPALFLTPFNIYDIAAAIAPPACDAPTALTVSNVTFSSATVSFTPSTSARSGYTVTTSPATTTQTLPASATSANLTGLAPNTNYTVNIASNCAGGATSSTATVSFTTAANPTPVITSLSPASVTAGAAAQTLTVNGTDFISSSTVSFNGTTRTTTFVSATQLTIQLTAADQATAGSYPVTVTTPTPGGGTSNTVNFTVNPAPCSAPSGLASSGVTSTSATVTFTGSGTATGYTVTTSPATTTQTLPANATSANFTGLTPGTAYTVSIVSNCAGGATSSPATVSFTTAAPNPAPTITSLSPASVTAGAAAQTLTVNGTNFLNSSTVSFNGTTRATTFVSATQLTIQLTAADQATAGTYNVTVTTPTPGGGTSNTATFTVNPAACNAPSGLASSNVTSNSATVTFTGSGTAIGYTVLTAPSTTTQTLPANATSVNLTGLTPNTNYTVLITSNCAGGANSSPATVSFTTTAAPLTDLTVSTTQNVQGSYNNVTVTSTGIANLTGTLTVAGTLTVQTGGGLVQNCQLVTGNGSFVLQAGANLVICDPAGITASGATGAIRVSGSRSFSPDASYAYNNPGAAQVTGSGLPSRVLNLVVANPASLTLSQAVSVTQVLRLQAGNLNTNTQALTLLSSAAGTALVDNTGGVVNGTATVQRYIDPSRNAGVGYRHYSAPVSNSTVADLTTSGFAPIVNLAYNTVGNTVTPFPNVFGYDQSRVTTSGNAGSIDFDKGFFSPNTLGDALVPTQGYTVNISASALVDFVGTLNNGPLTTGTLPRGTQTESGWHLRGNPYPAPLNWNTLVSNGRLSGIDNALYVFKSSGQYTGSYASYVNGQSTNGGTNVLPLGQGFFVRTSTAGAAGSISFTNAERLTAFDATPFQRTTADSRTQLLLSLSNATAATQAAIYFDRGATPSFDKAFDALSLPGSNGLTLVSEAGAETLAINGQPILSGADVLVPLRVASAAAGTYTLAVDNLANLPAGYHAYLRDALTGTYTDLGTTPTVSLTLAANAAAGGRYAVLFTTQARVLATAPAALAKLANVYPNPAHGSATLLLPVALRGTQATAVSVVDNLGRTVLTRTLAAGAAETLELPLGGLATGVYSVQARTASGLVVKRLVVE